MRLYSHRDRPFHWGPLALEALARTSIGEAVKGLAVPRDRNAPGDASVIHVLAEYFALFRAQLQGSVASARAPIPEDRSLRAANLKASAYFLDACIVGGCAIDSDDWLDASLAGHTHALVFAVEFGREPRAGDPGEAWVAGSNAARTDLRATEVAAVLSGYLRRMGFSATGHAPGAAGIDLAVLGQRAGVVRAERGVLRAPYLSRGFSLAAVTTDFEFEPDLPLDPGGALSPDDPAVIMGRTGARPAWWDAELDRRPLHWGRYPMERIPRRDTPTTLVEEGAIQRVPKRADFFKRAQAGDLGDKAKRERMRFPMKHPYALGMQPLIAGMVPLQGTREPLVPSGIGGDLSDPQTNANAIKALGYFLGADFVGICRAEPWMYYSHDEVEGKPIAAYHRFAVVMLIDQGFETMEGASGDDWISASQSMRAYMRGAEIAGIMAAHCRRMGYSARSHSNAHSEVIHNPAILMAGLGEVSRIGDTILNPFIGPRSKSVVFTTDLPLAVDRPIDFNLQSFCEACRKCARECPCNAIPFGPKVMFNGYETWKADVEKCTKYRVTNMKGSACGRCMKTCPWNREDTVEAERLMWLSIERPELASAIAADDDAVGNGMRNPVKRWWFDLEVVDGIAGHPSAGVNERDLDLERIRLGERQKLAMFPPALQPAGGTTLDTVVPVDRERGLAAYADAEPVERARARLAAIPVIAK